MPERSQIKIDPYKKPAFEVTQNVMSNFWEAVQLPVFYLPIG
jgi:hypothetical protein